MQEDVVRFTVLLEDLTRDVRIIAEAQASEKERLDRMEKSVGGIDKKLDRLEMRHDLLETEVKGLGAEVKRLGTEVKGLGTEVKGLGTEVKELRTEVKELRTEVKGLEAGLTEFSIETRGRLERIETRIEPNGPALPSKSTRRLPSKPRKKS
jgi:chromosome segregation ATPase